MEAGIVLDRIIMTKVMGIEPQKYAIATKDKGLSAAACQHPDGPFYTDAQIRDWVEEHPDYEVMYVERIDKRYSTDISAAWEVVEKLLLNDWCYKIEPFREVSRVWLSNGTREYFYNSNSIPHAICMLALITTDEFKPFPLNVA